MDGGYVSRATKKRWCAEDDDDSERVKPLLGSTNIYTLMKKRILLSSVSAILFSTLFMSYDNGPGQESNLNISGTSGPGTCGLQGYCHVGGTYTSTVTTVMYDSMGTATVNSWKPGRTYKLVCSGASSAPKYGFQFSAAYYTGSTYLQAGTFSILSTNTHNILVGGFDIVEHSQPLNVVGGQISHSRLWTAPNSTSIDTVDFYLMTNNVNGNGNVNGDNSIRTVAKYGRDTTTSTASITPQLNANLTINTYPNPVTDKLNITISHADKGSYTISLFDMQGKLVNKQTADVNGAYSTSVNTTSLAAGMYHVQLKKDGAQKTMMVVKE
jgi:hypothetical protein